MKNQYVEHRDRLGNLIEIGDTILRPLWANLYEEKVVDITSKSIYLEAFKCICVNGKIDDIPYKKRISVSTYRPEKNFINLTKLKYDKSNED